MRRLDRILYIKETKKSNLKCRYLLSLYKRYVNMGIIYILKRNIL